MKYKSIVSPIILVALLSVVSCSKDAEYDATGIFDATTVTVSAETTGKIMSLDVCEGDSIICGQNLGVIDTIPLVLKRRQLESQMSSVRSNRPDISAQVAALRQQIAQQQTECRRIASLMVAGAATQKQEDDANAALRILDGQLRAALSTLGNNTESLSGSALAVDYQIKQIDDQIVKSRISAPISGIVLEKYAEAYEFAPAGRQLFKVADMSDVYLRAYFTSEQLADLKLGQKVEVVADYGADRQYSYPGTVTYISQESQFTPKSIQTKDSRASLVYAVKIAVPNDGRIKLGMYGGVKL